MPFSPGTLLFTLIGLFTMLGPYAADWNETHVKNPNWPPHARFHNGQTMSTGLLLGLLILYYTHIAKPRDVREGKLFLRWAVTLVHLYYVPALSAIWYPGANWTDPDQETHRRQLYGFPALLGLSWVAWFLERSRLDNEGGKVKLGKD